MHINHENLDLKTESDVEQKLLMPLLSGTAYLEIPTSDIFTKEFLAPTDLDKSAGRVSGYFPDYTIWMRGFVVLVVEAKAPDTPAETGYREASLYARHLNQNYPPDLNPCRFIIATNGKTLLFGHWDCAPLLAVDVSNLRVGLADLDKLQQVCGARALGAHAEVCLKAMRVKGVLPCDLAGGVALLNARRPLNSFAAPLSPVLQRYFSSSPQERNREIIEKAYVSSSEVTEYDKILEALLKERLSIQRDSIVEELHPGRRGEEHVARAISEFAESRPAKGQLQIIQGAVGSGKSLFIQRYKEILQPDTVRKSTRWAVIDFNTAPPDLSHAESWLCKAFIEAFERDNPLIDLTSMGVLRGIYSRNIQKRKAIYKELERVSPERSATLRAEDMAGWQGDNEETARGLAEYILGGRREVLVCVLDNVDRLDLANQLKAFQLSLWFMELTRCFTILQMRDETYERFKNQPPLDTFRTGIAFHISPPRFVDVVKRRLELSIEYLESNVERSQSFTLESGMRVTYLRSDLELFLRELYTEVFDRTRNISRVLEAIAGRDVRRALEMFVSIITSGHLSPNAITSTVMGGRGRITEALILKILMRTGYRFFSENSGFVSNIFRFSPELQRPDNFLFSEVLWFLAKNRKRRGEIGIEGYFTCRHVASQLQRLSYVPEDVLWALNQLLKKQLIAADHMNFTKVEFDDSVRILASGWIHIRFLSERMEYVYGVIPTTPIAESHVAHILADIIKNESLRGDINPHQKLRAIEVFYDYLARELNMRKTPFTSPDDSGASYTLRHIRSVIEHLKNVTAEASHDPDPLDF